MLASNQVAKQLRLMKTNRGAYSEAEVYRVLDIAADEIDRLVRVLKKIETHSATPGAIRLIAADGIVLVTDLPIHDEVAYDHDHKWQPASDAEALAKLFHETYERLAPQFGYETRKASAVPWDQVPEQNKALMIAVCRELELLNKMSDGRINVLNNMVIRLRGENERYVRVLKLYADQRNWQYHGDIANGLYEWFGDVKTPDPRQLAADALRGDA